MLKILLQFDGPFTREANKNIQLYMGIPPSMISLDIVSFTVTKHLKEPL